ncbi:unnamed protein product [Chondrus crispus]|uniref:Ribosomal RNA-processing protein 42 n=1 Tax=Chondrus crispus TaxID=2769 RepID=R7QD87_CHOCR|nr:unnamed protein product [Chondrus crispus]CDF35410.1 unnamed protein product [Chondrus crispus]|eukprot:XP_005715229.1 unnamed protein product [Chondrus crispus]
MLSGAEKTYIEAGAAQGIRADGRGLLDLRPVTLETSLLPTASGSARVRIGGVTDILVGVKAEVVEPHVNAPDEGLMSFAVECSSLASPDFVGRGGADLNAELSQLLTRLYASSATRELRRGLALIPGRKCWVLHVDALVLDSGGNLYGALSLAVRAALRVVTLPRVVIIPGEADDDDEIEVNEEVFERLSRSEDAPVAVTLSAVGGRGIYIADSTSEEEACAKAAITMGVNLAGRACGAVSGGTGGVDMDTLKSMLKDAVRVGGDILKTTDSFLQDDIARMESGEEVEPVGFFS